MNAEGRQGRGRGEEGGEGGREEGEGGNKERGGEGEGGQRAAIGDDYRARPEGGPIESASRVAHLKTASAMNPGTMVMGMIGLAHLSHDIPAISTLDNVHIYAHLDICTSGYCVACHHVHCYPTTNCRRTGCPQTWANIN